LAGTLARMPPDAGSHKDGTADRGSERTSPSCATCGGRTRFAGGESTHDLYAERFICLECGRETYRSFGRGSVS